MKGAQMTAMSDVDASPNRKAIDGAPALERSFRLRTSFAFSLAFISPVVALYGVFDLSIGTAGPSFWLAFPLIFVMQLVIASVLGELVSQWPVEGSIYQWTRRLAGARAGWFGGWVYIWTLVVSMASVSTGAAQFLLRALGVNASSGELAAVAVGVVLVGLLINVAGSLALRIVVTVSIIAETLSTIGVGVLLLFHRHQHLSVLTSGGVHGLSRAYVSGPFLLAIAILGYSFVGFESAGSLAEEVHEPRRNLPRAMIFSMAFVAIIVSFAGLALILSTPNMHAVLAGKVADPVYATLTANLGSSIARVAEIMFTVAFLASFLAVQTTASRMVWSYARDRALPGAGVLSRLSAKRKEPAWALLAVSIIAVVILLLAQATPKIYELLVNFSAAGFFAAYLFPLIGALVARRRGTWTPGPFTLGRASLPLGCVAVLFALAQFINIAWPRHSYPEWYLNWAVWLVTGVILVTGLILYRRVYPRMTITVAASDDADEVTPDRLGTPLAVSSTVS
jgi:amino acid transporter